MTVGLAYNGDLSRIQIAISGFPNGLVTVERSTNELLWSTVRGGVALPISGGAGSLDDYEFAADVENHYRVTQANLEDNVDVFTSSGTWTKPPGLVAAKITCVGGGGGGGGAATTSSGQGAEGGGGGSGAVAVAFIPAADLGATETVTVGAAGAGSAGGSGTNGGTTTFTVTGGTDVTAGGGGGASAGSATGTANQNSGGTGATTGTGDLVIPGETGFYGKVRSGACEFENRGGATAFGPGARAPHSNSTDGAAPAGGYGGGGSGSRNAASQGTARAGGAGAGGLVIVEHIFAG